MLRRSAHLGKLYQTAGKMVQRFALDARVKGTDLGDGVAVQFGIEGRHVHGALKPPFMRSSGSRFRLRAAMFSRRTGPACFRVTRLAKANSQQTFSPRGFCHKNLLPLTRPQPTISLSPPSSEAFQSEHFLNSGFRAGSNRS